MGSLVWPSMILPEMDTGCPPANEQIKTVTKNDIIYLGVFNYVVLTSWAGFITGRSKIF